METGPATHTTISWLAEECGPEVCFSSARLFEMGKVSRMREILLVSKLIHGEASHARMERENRSTYIYGESKFVFQNERFLI